MGVTFAKTHLETWYYLTVGIFLASATFSPIESFRHYRWQMTRPQHIAGTDVCYSEKSTYCTSTFIIGRKTLVNLREDIVLTHCFFKVWWQLPLFLFILSFSYIHNHIYTVHLAISILRGLSPFSSLLVSLRGKNLPGVTSRVWTRGPEELSSLCPETSMKLYVQEFSFWTGKNLSP